MNEPKNPCTETSKEELQNILQNNLRKLKFVRIASSILNFAILMTMAKERMTETGFLILSGVFVLHMFVLTSTMWGILKENDQIHKMLKNPNSDTNNNT